MMGQIEVVKNYEIGFLVKDDNDRQEIVRILSNHQMPIINEGQISQVKLAYPIKKENCAYFGYLYFSARPRDIKKLREELQTSPKILRFIIIANPVLKDGRPISGQVEPIKKHSAPESSFVSNVEASSLKKEKIKSAKTEVLSNEALEKKLEEILK